MTTGSGTRWARSWRHRTVSGANLPRVACKVAWSSTTSPDTSGSSTRDRGGSARCARRTRPGGTYGSRRTGTSESACTTTVGLSRAPWRPGSSCRSLDNHRRILGDLRRLSSAQQSGSFVCAGGRRLHRRNCRSREQSPQAAPLKLVGARPNDSFVNCMSGDRSPLAAPHLLVGAARTAIRSIFLISLPGVARADRSDRAR